MIIEGPDGKDRNTHRGMDADTGIVVTFNNVTISITGTPSAEDAYDRLCAAVATVEDDAKGIHAEWTTDTYTTWTQGGTETHPISTKDLFPAEGSARETQPPTLRVTLDAIHDKLDGQRWTPDTIDAVAHLLREAGYTILDVNGDETT